MDVPFLVPLVCVVVPIYGDFVSFHQDLDLICRVEPRLPDIGLAVETRSDLLVRPYLDEFIRRTSPEREDGEGKQYGQRNYLLHFLIPRNRRTDVGESKRRSVPP